MPIEFACGNCGKRLRVKDEAAGKRVRCNGCQTVLQVPGAGATPAPTAPTPSPSASTPSAPTPSAPAAPAPSPSAPSALWHMKTEDGQTYGPVSKPELDSWLTEGRLTADSQVLQDGSSQWQWATDLYPQLGGAQQPAPASPTAEAENPFAFAAADAGPTARPRMGGAAAPAFRTDDASPYAAPQTTSSRTSGVAAGKQSAGEPAWHTVSTGLNICALSLAVATGAFLIFGLMMLVAKTGPVFSPFGPSMGGAAFMSILMFWAMIGLMGSVVAVLTSWFVCATVPRRAGADLMIRGAILSIGVLLLLFFIITLVGVSAASAKSMSTMIAIARITQFLTWMSVAAWCAAFALFGFFLSQVGKFFGDRQLTQFAVIYAIFEGVLLLVFTLVMLGVLKPTSATMAQAFMAVGLLFGLAHFGWSMFMSFKANQLLKHAIARAKRGH